MFWMLQTEAGANILVQPPNLKDALWEAIKPKNKDNPQIDKKARLQRQILSSLPNDFLDNLKQEIATESKKPDKMIAGHLFETLVSLDPTICEEQETKIGYELRELMAHPGKYCQSLSYERFRVPDLARVRVTPNEVEVIGVFEAKAGPLDMEDLNQIGGFERNLADIFDVLKETDKSELEKSGLDEIAKHKDNFTISADFEITLAVPNGAYQDITTNLTNRNLSSEEERKFSDFLSDCTILECQFNRKEIRTLTETILKYLENKN
jgi:hypothetical protein